MHIKGLNLITKDGKHEKGPITFFYPVTRQEQVILVVGAACSREIKCLRLQGAPTGLFYDNLDFPGKHLIFF